jgi:hypothetical protein
VSLDHWWKLCQVVLDQYETGWRMTSGEFGGWLRLHLEARLDPMNNPGEKGAVAPDLNCTSNADEAKLPRGSSKFLSQDP